MLTSSVCGTGPSQYFKKSSVVQSFPDKFKMVSRDTLRVADDAKTVFKGKAVSYFEVVVSSFGSFRCFVAAPKRVFFIRIQVLVV